MYMCKPACFAIELYEIYRLSVRYGIDKASLHVPVVRGNIVVRWEIKEYSKPY